MNLNEFIQQTTNITNIQELKQLFINFINQYGYTSFILSDMTPPSINEKNENFNLIENYPKEWLEHYKTNNYPLKDPVYLMGLTASIPYTWETIMKKTLNHSSIKVMDEAREFGLVNGMGFPINIYTGNKLGVGISTSENARNNQIALYEINCAVQHFSLVYLQLQGYVWNNQRQKLSPREKEVLCWISNGYTKKTIAEKIGVSYSCIKRHCESIFIKLDVKTLAAAVAVALRTGEIEF